MALHEYEQLLMQITFKFDPEDSQFSHPAIVRRSVLPYPLRRGLYPWVPYPSVPLIARLKGYPTF